MIVVFNAVINESYNAAIGVLVTNRLAVCGLGKNGSTVKLVGGVVLLNTNTVGVIFKGVIVERLQERCILPTQLMPTEGDGIPLPQVYLIFASLSSKKSPQPLPRKGGCGEH